jgi:hypothetical protein
MVLSASHYCQGRKYCMSLPCLSFIKAKKSTLRHTPKWEVILPSLSKQWFRTEPTVSLHMQGTTEEEEGEPQLHRNHFHFAAFNQCTRI